MIASSLHRDHLRSRLIRLVLAVHIEKPKIVKRKGLHSHFITSIRVLLFSICFQLALIRRHKVETRSKCISLYNYNDTVLLHNFHTASSYDKGYLSLMISLEA